MMCPRHCLGICEVTYSLNTSCPHWRSWIFQEKERERKRKDIPWGGRGSMQTSTWSYNVISTPRGATCVGLCCRGRWGPAVPWPQGDCTPASPQNCAAWSTWEPELEGPLGTSRVNGKCPTPRVLHVHLLLLTSAFLLVLPASLASSSAQSDCWAIKGERGVGYWLFLRKEEL